MTRSAAACNAFRAAAGLRLLTYLEELRQEDLLRKWDELCDFLRGAVAELHSVYPFRHQEPASAKLLRRPRAPPISSGRLPNPLPSDVHRMPATLILRLLAIQHTARKQPQLPHRVACLFDLWDVDPGLSFFCQELLEPHLSTTPGALSSPRVRCPRHRNRGRSGGALLGDADLTLPLVLEVQLCVESHLEKHESHA